MSWRQLSNIRINSSFGNARTLWYCILNQKYIAQHLNEDHTIKGYSFGEFDPRNFKIIQELGLSLSFEEARIQLLSIT